MIMCTYRIVYLCVCVCVLFLAESLGNISSNYKIGFGTFVDKPVAPFSPLLPQGTGVLPYSYHHILTLTDDEDRFSVSNNTSFLFFLFSS